MIDKERQIVVRFCGHADSLLLPGKLTWSQVAQC